MRQRCNNHLHSTCGFKPPRTVTKTPISTTPPKMRITKQTKPEMNTHKKLKFLPLINFTRIAVFHHNSLDKLYIPSFALNSQWPFIVCLSIVVGFLWQRLFILGRKKKKHNNIKFLDLINFTRIAVFPAQLYRIKFTYKDGSFPGQWLPMSWRVLSLIYIPWTQSSARRRPLSDRYKYTNTNTNAHVQIYV